MLLLNFYFYSKTMNASLNKIWKLAGRLLLFCFAFILNTGSLSAKTLEVCTNCRYKTITSALKAANNGDRILVKKGIYKEGNLSINKSITLQGEDTPVIDGESKYEMLFVTAVNVTIKGFKFINSGFGNIKDIAAIKVKEARFCTISDNIFENNYFSVYLSNAKNCTVSRNKIKGNFLGETASGNGVHLWKCDSGTVTDNNIQGHRDGIYFEFVTNGKIFNNTSYNNKRYGLHFMFSDGNTYEGNHFKDNGAGVAVMYTRNVTMRNNIFDHNWGPSAYGLLLKDISRSTIENNIFIKNTVGIFMEESSKIKVRNNTFRNNGWAMKIMANCIEDTIASNNFIANSFDISTNSSMTDNIFTGNHWDKYAGYDLDKNNIGDIPYRPVSLFSLIMDKIPYSVMLMRSFVSGILDQVEKVYPDAIPESLLDEKPVMKEIQFTVNSKQLSVKK